MEAEKPRYHYCSDHDGEVARERDNGRRCVWAGVRGLLEQRSGHVVHGKVCGHKRELSSSMGKYSR